MFKEKDVISRYSSKQAVEDGFLLDLYDVIDKKVKLKHGLFRYVTTNLLRKGYIKDDKVNIPNLLDLVNQALEIVRKKSKNFKEFDYFFSGDVELPNGEKQDIFIEQNETGKFTLMLPEDRWGK